MRAQAPKGNGNEACLSSRTTLTHYFARRREKDLMEVHPTESNSGGAIIPNVQSFHPLTVVAKGELWPIRT